MDRFTTLRDPVDIDSLGGLLNGYELNEEEYTPDQNMKEEEMEVKVDADELCALRSAKNPEVIHGVVYHGIKHYEDLLAAKDKLIEGLSGGEWCAAGTVAGKIIAARDKQIADLEAEVSAKDKEIAELKSRLDIMMTYRSDMGIKMCGIKTRLEAIAREIV